MFPSNASTPDGEHDQFFREVAAVSAHVLVFKADPGLLDGVPPRAAQILAQRVRLPRMRLPAGGWEPVRPESAQGEVLGLLVLGGLVERITDVGARSGPELLGPGDVLRPWDQSPDCVAGCSWRVHERLELAVLDDRFTAVACRSPRILANVLTRTDLRSHGLAARLAIGQVRCAEDRVLLVLRGVAERWGRATPEGAHIPFALQHDTIGRLACMRRPTTSTALVALQRSGRLVRCADRTWLVPEDGAAAPAAELTQQAA